MRKPWVLNILFSLSALLCILLPPTLPVIAEKSYSVAVLPFEAGGNVDLSYSQKKEILSGVVEMITDRLANEEDLVLMERNRIKDILTEQRFQYSGMVDLSTAVEIGRILGVDILVLGNLNEFYISGSSGIEYGPLQIKGTTVKTELSSRLVGVETGRILASIKAEGKETGLNFSLDELEGLSVDSRQFKESVMGKALTKAVDSFARQFKKGLKQIDHRLSDEGRKISGEVVGIKGNYIIVNLGGEQGISTGIKLRVYRLESFAGLEEPVRLPNGSLQVISVDQEAAVAKILTTGDGMTIQIGDVVEVQE